MGPGAYADKFGMNWSQEKGFIEKSNVLRGMVQDCVERFSSPSVVVRVTEGFDPNDWIKTFNETGHAISLDHSIAMSDIRPLSSYGLGEIDPFGEAMRQRLQGRYGPLEAAKAQYEQLMSKRRYPGQEDPYESINRTRIQMGLAMLDQYRQPMNYLLNQKSNKHEQVSITLVSIEGRQGEKGIGWEREPRAIATQKRLAGNAIGITKSQRIVRFGTQRGTIQHREHIESEIKSTSINKRSGRSKRSAD